jgi:hypothetical protein
MNDSCAKTIATIAKINMMIANTRNALSILLTSIKQSFLVFCNVETLDEKGVKSNNKKIKNE